MTKTRNDTKLTDFNSMIQYLTRETEEDSSRVELIMLAALASTLGQKYLVSSGEDHNFTNSIATQLQSRAEELLLEMEPKWDRLCP